MKIIPFDVFMNQQDFFVAEAKLGKIFVYPTDTIYGIGGIVSESTISKINHAKQRILGKHYSVIAPSFERVERYFEVSDFEQYRTTTKRALDEGRGLTLLCPYKKEYSDIFSKLSNNQNIGIRFLDHSIQKFVTVLGEGYVTTSANISGQKNIENISDLHESQKHHIDYAIDAGTLRGEPSVIIDYRSGQIIRS